MNFPRNYLASLGYKVASVCKIPTNKPGYWIYLFLVLVVGLSLSSPAFIKGLPDQGYDAIRHIKWFIAFSGQFWEGEIYPRWLTDINAGLGAPTFHYYAPLPYWVASLFRLFSWNDPWQAMGLSMAIALILSGLFAFLFLKELVDMKYATFGAIAYMIAPYHLHNLYSRAAISEFWAMTWMPLILYFVQRAIQGRHFAELGIAIGYALLICSHLPVLLIFAPIPVIYILIETPINKRLKLWPRIAFSIIAGFGLSAIYWMPALGLQDQVRIEHLSEWNWRPYDVFFVFNDYRNDIEFNRFLGLKRQSILALNMIIAAVCACFLIRGKIGIVLNRQRLFWIGVLVYGLFMSTPLSNIAWQHIPLLGKVLFPYRFIVLIDIAVTVLIALAVSSLNRPLGMTKQMLLACLCLIVLTWLYPTIDQVKARYSDRIKANKIVSRMDGYVEYFPAVLHDIKVKKWINTVSKVQIHSGNAEVEILKWRGPLITLRVTANEYTELDLGLFYHSQWEAFVGDSKKPLEIKSNGPNALTRISIPEGSHFITLRFISSRIEQLAKLISITTLILMILGSFKIWWFNNKIS